MIKKVVHSFAWRAEYIFDLVRGQRDKRQIIEPYIGYATPEHLIVRGRVLAALRRNKPLPTQSLWVNFKQMVSLFMTDEVAGVTVKARGATATTDDEGYFTLLLPRSDGDGWIDVDVAIEGREGSTACPVVIAQTDAALGIISDVDDTLIETGAYSLIRNLWTSLTGNALTRKVFPDAVSFLRQLNAAGRNPVYFVSSSPWNLHHFLSGIFARTGITRGPLFLRDLGLSKKQFITGSHGDHKGDSIDVLMAANPSLRFVLVGDTGQHDAFVYRDAIKRHPGRVQSVVLREPGPGPNYESQAAMEEIRAAGVQLLHGRSFDGLADQVWPEGRRGQRT